MDAPLKELGKLEKLTSKSSSWGKAEAVDAIIAALQNVKELAATGEVSEETWKTLCETLEAKKKEVDERQKEVYNSVARLGKAIDKVRTRATLRTLVDGLCLEIPYISAHIP